MQTCPECGQAAIIKGKAEYGGGYLCWKKKGGCGAKFPDGTDFTAPNVRQVDESLITEEARMNELRGQIQHVYSELQAMGVTLNDSVNAFVDNLSQENLANLQGGYSKLSEMLDKAQKDMEAAAQPPQGA